ncbi:MAG: tetratricopeptide repeat protein [Planctomycetota bacterium]|nr:tetratricopeptide repeat protein [Planctomycetota bacterium]
MKGGVGKHVPLITIVALATLVYVNSLTNEFIWDDIRGISRNHLIKRVRHIPQIFGSDLYAGTGERAGNYRPVLLTTFALDYAIFRGPRPWAFHLVNLFLHAGVSWLVFLVLSRLLNRSGEAPFLAACLFAVHPIHSEAVAVIMGRAELLAAGLLLGAWLITLSGRKGSTPLSLLLFLLALLSKETAAIFPVLYLVGIWMRGESWRAGVRYFLYACGVFLLYLPMRIVALGGFSPPADQTIFPGMGLLERVGAMLPVFKEYVLLCLFPVKQSLDYQFLTEQGAFGAVDGLAGAGLLIAAIGGIVLSWKRRSALGLGILLFLIPLIPVSNIIPVGEIMGERLLYLPSIGFCLLLGVVMARLPRRLRWTILTLIIACYGTLTIHRNGVLSDPGTSALYTLRHYPDSYKAHAEAGTHFSRRGEVDLARHHYTRALELKPRFEIPRVGLGVLLRDAGLLDAAAEHFTWMKKDRPGSYHPTYQLGEVLLMQGDRDAAEALFQEALGILPSEPNPRLNLGTLAYFDGDLEKASRIFLEVLGYHPDHAATLQNLAGLRARQGRYAEALVAMRSAIRWGEPSATAWYLIGDCEWQGNRQWKARKAYEEALRLEPDPTGATDLFRKARALEALGRPSEAIQMYRESIEAGDGLTEAARLEALDRIRVLGGE